MLDGKTFLAIIPARGGSKRLPRKNVMELAGKPLIAWTIEAALQSHFIDEVVVTTDNSEIINVAEEHGANVPFVRPLSLSDDNASTVDVVLHAVSYFMKKKITFDFIVLLQPTSPLRAATHIDEAISKVIEQNASAVISVSKTDHSPLWSNTLPESGDMSRFLKEEVKNKRSQDLPDYYRLNGAIYICSWAEFFEEKSFFVKKNIYAYEMDRGSSVDVDEAFDFYLAEYLMKSHDIDSIRTV